jgi:polar amino acid transport system substrate-binding protein
MKTLHKFFAIAFVAVFVLSACSQQPAAPANLYEKIMQKGTMVVGTSADYPPFESKDADGNFVGFDMDVINEIGKEMGVKIEVQDMGFDVLITGLQQSKIDAVIASMSATPEREEQIDFTNSYFFGDQTFLAAKDSPITFTDPKEAAKYKIGVQSATTHDAWVTENLVKPGLMPAENVSYYDRADNAALDLQAGRVDLIFIDAAPATELADNMGLKVVLSGDITHTAGAAIGIPKGETELKDAMDKAIQKLTDNGFIQSAKEKWGAK